MRRLRYVPEGGALVEVTCRTLHSRFLFRPSRNVNDIIVGVRRKVSFPCRCEADFLPAKEISRVRKEKLARRSLRSG